MMAFAAIHHLKAGESSPIGCEIAPQWRVESIEPQQLITP
jgi:hypothetical protein